MWADEIQLGDVQTQKIEIPKADYKSKQSLVVKDEQILSELIRLQKEKDLEDIETLAGNC